MSAEMQIAIDVLREAARDLRVRADEQRDGDIANTMREAAIIVDALFSVMFSYLGI